MTVVYHPIGPSIINDNYIARILCRLW